jgi:uncharacterized protein YggE
MDRAVVRLCFASTSLAIALLVCTPSRAQSSSPARSEGTLLLMTGAAEAEVANDEAVAQFYFEAQEPDLARAQSLVNQRVAEAVAQLKRAEPKAQVESAGYGSYPVYQPGTQRKLVGWRVRQNVTLRTRDLATLPRAVSVAQALLALGGIQFDLSREAREKVEADLIALAIANLNDKIAAAARALAVPPGRVRLEEVNFGGAPPIVPMVAHERGMAMANAAPVEEPQLDAGRTLQRLTVSAKARLLPP